MIQGLGTDLCPSKRWMHLIQRFGERSIRRVLGPEEADEILSGNNQNIPDRMAGRWALREAFGKAIGLGMSGWSWKELRYSNGKMWAEGRLAELLAERKVGRLHASVSHDNGIAIAVVVLEDGFADNEK